MNVVDFVVDFLIKQKNVVARGRIELPTPCFSDKCSTD